jgi:hypothetical protein
MSRNQAAIKRSGNNGLCYSVCPMRHAELLLDQVTMIGTFDNRMQSIRSWIQHRAIEKLGHDTA